MTHRILVIDDEEDIREILSDIFEDEGYEVVKAAHSEQAFALLKNHYVDLIVLDIWLDNSDMDGMQILKHLKQQPDRKNIPILMISGHGNVEMAVNAMKIGAFDFIEKPFKIDHILLTVNRALEQKSLIDENLRLKQNGQGTNQTEEVHRYKSTAYINLIKKIEEDKNSDARMIIKGACGTGKTHIAKLIHSMSSRSKNTCNIVNASDLTPSNLDYTITETGQGSLIIENIEFCTTDTQGELLKILNKSDITCRFIATSGNDLHEMAQNGKFSSALYDRLAVLTYAVPSLSERKEDMDFLIKNFIETVCKEFHCTTVILDHNDIDYLKTQSWPGNIRQLKTAVEWMVMEKLFGANTSQKSEPSATPENGNGKNIITYPDIQSAQSPKHYTSLPLKQAREQFETDYLRDVMEKFSGNIAKMADYIDMERTALYRKLKSLGLSYMNDHERKAESS